MTILNNGQPVTNEADLNAAITAANAAAPGSYTIEIGAQINLTTALAAIDLHSGVSLSITGTTADGSAPHPQTIDGENDQRGFFIYSGDVTIDDLTIANAVAVGSAGASGGGGGGAGLGGGLFVAGSVGQAVVPVVTLDNVKFSNDAAKGGSGGAGGAQGGHGGQGGEGIAEGIGLGGGSERRAGGSGAGGRAPSLPPPIEPELLIEPPSDRSTPTLDVPMIVPVLVTVATPPAYRPSVLPRIEPAVLVTVPPFFRYFTPRRSRRWCW